MRRNKKENWPGRVPKYMSPIRMEKRVSHQLQIPSPVEDPDATRKAKATPLEAEGGHGSDGEDETDNEFDKYYHRILVIICGYILGIERVFQFRAGK